MTVLAAASGLSEVAANALLYCRPMSPSDVSHDRSTIPEPRPVADLVRRAQSGDRAAEQEIVQRYSRGILFLLRRLTRNFAWADDLHQETFRVVLERIRRQGLDDPEGLSAFLHGTARHLFLNHSRKVDRRKTDDAGDDLPERTDPSADPLGEALLNERSRLVRRLLDDLRPDRDRQILYRFYLAEEDSSSICQDFGLSKPQFNRVLHRARRRFKTLLDGRRQQLAEVTE